MALRGEIRVLGDKSITHRALILASMAQGESRIIRPLKSEDTLRTLHILEALGTHFVWEGEDLIVQPALYHPSLMPLDCGNSGTTARLLMGLLCAQPFQSTLIGDPSLMERPMNRVAEPLRTLGARIVLTASDHLPAQILPSSLKGGRIHLTVPSAQVKSAVLIAALQQKEEVVVQTVGTTRDHTERMITYLGGNLKKEGRFLTISGDQSLMGKPITVPGDLSAAAFFIVAALLVPDSTILLRDVGLNPTRAGLFTVLSQTGAKVEYGPIRLLNGEPVGDIRVTYTKDLKPFSIDEHLVPLLIDEIPILSLLATQIDGVSIIQGASELRVKESDRLQAIYTELKALGADIEETADGLIIRGKCQLHPATVSSHGDHRISMMLQIAEILTGPLFIQDRTVDQISYPRFSSDLRQLLDKRG